MPLQDYQHQVGALIMGPGTALRLSDVDGFGLGEKRERRYPIAGAEGTAWGREWRDGPTVTFEGAVHTPGDPAACTAAIAVILDNWQAAVDETVPKAVATYTWKWPGRPERSVLGRPNICRVATNQIVLGRAAFTLTFDCQTKLVV